MATMPRAYIDGMTKAVNQLSAAGKEQLAAQLATIDMSLPVEEVREQVIAIMQAMCGGYTDMAAMLAAEMYDGLREWELGERMGAVAESGRVPAATDGAVRAFAQKLVDDLPEQFVMLCLERLDYEIKRASAETVLINGRRDQHRPHYARVPSGAETCDFCLMLASRGFVYKSLAAASHFHSGCDCRVVPSWRAYKVEGYDPTKIFDQWQAAVDAKAEERAERSGKSVDEERKSIMATYERAATNAKKANKR